MLTNTRNAAALAVVVLGLLALVMIASFSTVVRIVNRVPTRAEFVADYRAAR